MVVLGLALVVGAYTESPPHFTVYSNGKALLAVDHRGPTIRHIYPREYKEPIKGTSLQNGLDAAYKETRRHEWLVGTGDYLYFRRRGISEWRRFSLPVGDLRATPSRLAATPDGLLMIAGDPRKLTAVLISDKSLTAKLFATASTPRITGATISYFKSPRTIVHLTLGGTSSRTISRPKGVAGNIEPELLTSTPTESYVWYDQMLYRLRKEWLLIPVAKGRLGGRASWEVTKDGLWLIERQGNAVKVSLTNGAKVRSTKINRSGKFNGIYRQYSGMCVMLLGERSTIIRMTPGGLSQPPMLEVRGRPWNGEIAFVGSVGAVSMLDGRLLKIFIPPDRHSKGGAQIG